MELRRHNAAAAEELTDAVYAVVAAQYPQTPPSDSWRDGVWATHRARPGFELITADHDELVGLAWGYIGDYGQVWHDMVAEGLSAEIAEAWLGGAFEVVELLVAPSARRRGLGRELLRELVAGTTADRALLGVYTANVPATALYESAGWRRLGTARPGYEVMGLRLRP